MGAQDSEVGMSQERRVYSKFLSPVLADIANMRLGVSKDCIIEAWVATRLSIHQAFFRPSNQLLYFCATAEGGTSDIEAKTLVSPKLPRRLEPVRIDARGALFVGIKVQVEPDEFTVVHAALRLSGISVDRLEDL